MYYVITSYNEEDDCMFLNEKTSIFSREECHEKVDFFQSIEEIFLSECKRESIRKVKLSYGRTTIFGEIVAQTNVILLSYERMI